MTWQEIRAQTIYGSSVEEAIRANGGAPLRSSRCMAMFYQDARRTAKRRGVGWEITFPEWAGLWRDSGRWSERGPAPHQYVMARNGDEGPYKVGNVSIQPARINMLDGGRKLQRILGQTGYRPSPGSERGWTYRDRRSKPYQVMVGKQYVGCYSTQTEAEAAYALARTKREAEVRQ